MLLLAFAGVLIAVVLRSLAELVAGRTPLGPRAALAVVVLVLLAILGLGGWALAGQVMVLVRMLYVEDVLGARSQAEAPGQAR